MRNDRRVAQKNEVVPRHTAHPEVAACQRAHNAPRATHEVPADQKVVVDQRVKEIQNPDLVTPQKIPNGPNHVHIHGARVRIRVQVTRTRSNDDDVREPTMINQLTTKGTLKDLNNCKKLSI